MSEAKEISHEDLALLRSRVEHLEQEQRELHALLWGNGKAGLRDDVAAIKQWVGSMRKWMNIIAGVLVTQLIGGSLAFIWMVLEHLMKAPLKP